SPTFLSLVSLLPSCLASFSSSTSLTAPTCPDIYSLSLHDALPIYLIMLLLQSIAPSGYSRKPQAPKLLMQQISTCVPAKPLELRCLRCSMLQLQCLAVGLYNTKPLTSKLRNSCCVPAKHLELRRQYLI